MTSVTIGSNTYNLCTIPASPSPSQFSLTMNDTVATVKSSFTQQMQTQYWAGGDWWGLKITLPPIVDVTARQWKAFLSELRGQSNIFQYGDLRATSPLGAVSGSPLVNGANAALSQTLSIRALPVSVNNVFMAGDYIQVGYRLHMILESVNSDSNGDATVSIFPCLRDSLADGTAITYRNTLGCFRLTSNARTIGYDVNRLWNLSIDAVEVR